MSLKFIESLFRKDYDNSYNNESYMNYQERKRLMNFNRFFSKRKVFTGVYTAASVLILIFAVAAVNQLQRLFSGISPDASVSDEKISLASTIISCRWLIIIAAAALFVYYFVFAYKVRTAFGNLNVGQKGTSRWTTRKELDEQFVKIDERETEFKGMGGIPIARQGDKLYIDNTNVNNLIIGGTRSGKGQTVIEPMIEIISRAEEKCSMIITDPKMELANKSLPLLKKRGYETHILNLIDPEYSMGYNPLTLIIQEYKDGNEDIAQQLTSSLAYTVLPRGEEKDPYWTDQARNVFTAAVYADLEDNIKLDAENNMRWKHRHEEEEDRRETLYFKKLYGNDYQSFLLKRHIDDILKVKADISDEDILSELDLMQKYGALSKELDGLQFFDQFSIEDICSIRELKYKESTFERKEYRPSNENEKKINLHSIVKMCNSLYSIKIRAGWTGLDEYFFKRSEDNFARALYSAVMSASEQTKGTIMSVFSNKITTFNFNSIGKMTAESTLDFFDVGFGEKSVAVFIALPDYDTSNWFIATVFINQMYFTLAKLATAMPENKLPRRVSFMLDEFGNMPPLDNMESIVTVCLGRNITFTLAIQSTKQLTRKYDDADSIIKGNCGNWIYIMSTDMETVKEISEMLGSETITTVNRTGKKLSITKELTEMTDEKELMTMPELLKLEMGESIVLRPMYRQARGTVSGVAVKATPIANMGEYRMKYAHEYLSDLMPADQLLYESANLEKIRKRAAHLKKQKLNIVDAGIETRKYIDLKKRIRSGQEYYEFLERMQEPFVPYEEERSYENAVKLNMALNCLNIGEDRQLYTNAGLIVDSEIQNPEYVLINSKLVEYAKQLIECDDIEARERGFSLLDLVLPLADKPASEGGVV